MMKKLLSLLCVGATVLLAACNPQFDKKTLRLEAMDTFMQCELYGVDALTVSEIRTNLQGLDEALSVTQHDGAANEIYNLNQSGSLTVSDSTAELTRQALALCADTDGALDITVLPLVEEWGFLSKNYHIPSKERLAQLLPLVGYDKVQLDGNTVTLPQGTKIDFGAVAKGYAADVSFGLLKKLGATRAILNLGGTVGAFGEKEGGKPWRVGIADPDNSAAYMGWLDCRDKIIATSGSYERYFEGDDGKIYSHILHPQTGVPVDNGILSVTIVSDNGVRSDGLSTALFVMGLEKAEAYYRSHRDFDYIILTADKKVYLTPGVAAAFTQANGYDYEVVVSSQ